MKMRIVNHLIVIVFFSNLSFGVIHGQSDFVITEDESEVQAKLKTISQNTTSISCDFVQEKQLSFMKHKMVSNGKFYFANGDQLRWEYNEPYNYAVLMVKDRFVIIDEGKVNETKMGKNPAIKEIQQLLTQTLTGNFEAQQDKFEQVILENEFHYCVRLLPRDDGMKQFISSIEVYFLKKSFLLDKFIMDENGDISTTLFSNQLINKKIPSEIFQWD